MRMTVYRYTSYALAEAALLSAAAAAAAAGGWGCCVSEDALPLDDRTAPPPDERVGLREPDLRSSSSSS